MKNLPLTEIFCFLDDKVNEFINFDQNQCEKNKKTKRTKDRLFVSEVATIINASW